MIYLTTFILFRRGTYIPSTPKIKPSILIGAMKKLKDDDQQSKEQFKSAPQKFSNLKTPIKSAGENDWRFSVGQLPGWAKKTVINIKNNFIEA